MYGELHGGCSLYTRYQKEIFLLSRHDQKEALPVTRAVDEGLYPNLKKEMDKSKIVSEYFGSYRQVFQARSMPHLAGRHSSLRLTVSLVDIAKGNDDAI